MTETLQTALGHDFKDSGLLDAALVHRSYTAEHPEVPDNERHEFLGDAVLQLVVTDFLFEHFPDMREGEMAKVRAACVNRVELAAVARAVGLGKHLLMGVGELASGGRAKDSILADAMEAVLCAIYLDSGLDAARRVILDHWADRIRAKALEPGRRDFKTRLQERLAVTGLRPVYDVEEAGPDHAKVFRASVSVDGVVLGSGSGRSKKEAQQEAARQAMGDESDA
ncbi:MAG TPA: ribonuclease III [Acidimicrobiia bacterium]|nr:ribonuclease III [Acidimicrobiia bacterium]